MGLIKTAEYLLLPLLIGATLLLSGLCDGLRLQPSRKVADGCDWKSTSAFLSKRRQFSSSVAWSLGFVCSLPVVEPSQAASPVNPAEALRRSAANIPGYGQTDVFYPLSFEGNWKAVREILPTMASGTSLQLEYPVRFLKSIEDDAVVADRGWNQANLEKAIKQASSKDDSAVAPSYQWVETNPNDLRLTFADGTQKDIKVTKRATEKSDETVFSSEFQRVSQDDARGIPVITARRVLNKWKVIDPSTIEGIEVIYDAGGGDPMTGSSRSDQNKVLSKSRLRLERIGQ